MRRLRLPQSHWMALLALLACAALLRGPQFLAAWHRNRAALALRPEWLALQQLTRLAPCQQWTSESAAAQPLSRARELDPQYEHRQLNEGRVAWLQGDCEAALDAWSSLASADVLARLEQANGLLALGRTSEALALYQQITDAGEYLYIRGLVAEASTDADAAITWYELSMQVLPDVRNAHYLTELYLKRGQYQAALAVLQRLGGQLQGDLDWAWRGVAMAAVSAGDWETALRVFESGAAQSPDPCALWEGQVEVLHELERWADVEALSLRALAECPQESWPYLRLGNLRRREDDYAAALHWYRQAEELWPDLVPAKFYIGLIYFRQEQYEQARAQFEQVLALEPDHAWGTYFLASCLRESGDTAAAVDTLRRAIQLQEGDPWEMALELGDWLVEFGRPQEALAAYQQALDAWGSVEPTEDTARLQRANDLVASGRTSEALALYRQVTDAAPYLYVRGLMAEVSADPAAAITWYELSMEVVPDLRSAHALVRLRLETGQHRSALAVLERLGDAEQGDHNWLWWDVAKAAHEAGDHETALRTFELGAAQSGGPCAFWEGQEQILEELEEWAQAEAISLRALAECPQEPWPYLRLGDLRRREEDYGAALRWYRQAEELSPDLMPAKFYIGWIHFKQEKYNQARVYFEQALALEPDHDWSTYYLAWCQYKGGDTATAVETLARAIDLYDGEPWEMALELGDWLVELGQSEEALAAYQQALSWNPGDEGILERIDRLIRPSP